MTSTKYSPYRHVSVSVQLLQAPRVKNMSLYSSSVCFTIIRSQLSPAGHCVYCVHLTKRCVVMTIKLLRNVFPHLTVTCISKTSRRRMYVITKHSMEGLVRDQTCQLTLRSLTLYIYGAPILDVSRSHTTTQHSR